MLDARWSEGVPVGRSCGNLAWSDRARISSPDAAWKSDELNKIAAAEELQIASLRRNGTLGKLVTTWVVRHGDDVYVRSGYGTVPP